MEKSIGKNDIKYGMIFEGKKSSNRRKTILKSKTKQTNNENVFNQKILTEFNKLNNYNENNVRNNHYVKREICRISEVNIQ